LSSVLEPQFRLKWTGSPAEEMAAKSQSLSTWTCWLNKQQQLTSRLSRYHRLHVCARRTVWVYVDDTSTWESSTVVELDSYLADASNTEAQHKEQYPRLYKLHLKHHSIPATSAAMERCFSAAGCIACARRSSLSDDMLEAMLIAKCNKDFL